MADLNNLYKILTEGGYYTKSFEEFQAKWQDENYRSKVYDGMTRDKIYTKDRNSFNQEFQSASPTTTTTAATELKKKEAAGPQTRSGGILPTRRDVAMESASAGTSSASPSTDQQAPTFNNGQGPLAPTQPIKKVITPAPASGTFFQNILAQTRVPGTEYTVEDETPIDKEIKLKEIEKKNTVDKYYETDARARFAKYAKEVQKENLSLYSPEEVESMYQEWRKEDYPRTLSLSKNQTEIPQDFNIVKDVMKGLDFFGIKKESEDKKKLNVITTEVNGLDNDINNLQRIKSNFQQAQDIEKTIGKPVEKMTYKELAEAIRPKTDIEEGKYSDLNNFIETSGKVAQLLSDKFDYLQKVNADKIKKFNELNEDIDNEQDPDKKIELTAMRDAIKNDPSVVQMFAAYNRLPQLRKEANDELLKNIPLKALKNQTEEDKNTLEKIIAVGGSTVDQTLGGFLTLPKRLAETIGANEGLVYEYIDKPLDVIGQNLKNKAKLQFSQKGKDAMSSFVDVTDYDGGKLLVKDGKAYALVDNNYNELPDAEGLVSKWNSLPTDKKTKVSTEFNGAGTLWGTSQVVADMLPLIAGGEILAAEKGLAYGAGKLTTEALAKKYVAGTLMTIAQTHDSFYDQVKDNPNMTEQQKNAYAMAVATGISLLNMGFGGFEKRLLGAAEEETMKKIVTKNMAKIATGEISPITIVSEFAKATLKHAGKEIPEELTEEIFLEPLLQNAITAITNNATGANIETQSIDLQSIKDQALPIILSTGVMGSLGSYKGKNRLQNDAIYSASQDFNKFKETTTQLVMNKQIEPSVAATTINTVEKVANTINSVPGLTEQQKYNVSSLMLDNDKVQVFLDKNISEVLKDKYKARISENNAVIAKILGNEALTPEEVTANGLVEPPAAMEATEAMKPLTAEEMETKKADIESRRQEELGAYDEEQLNEAYTVGSKETIAERVNSKYDAELKTLEESQPAQEAKTVDQQIEDLRAKEQEEYAAMPDPNDEVAKKEIYDRYDKSITPLLESQKKQTEPTTGNEIAAEQVAGFNEGVQAAADAAREYRETFFPKNKQMEESHGPVRNLLSSVSKTIANAYENIVHSPNSPKVKRAYDALIKETKQQYEFLVSKGLNVERHEGAGEPYANSKEMLADIRDNNTIKFLPNEVAFGAGTTAPSDNIGLQPSGVKLKDGYEMTNSELFRVVHDYFGHGILGNQFGAIGEENATLQHLHLYSDEAAPAVIFQTRGQNSWVNFSGANEQSNQLRKQARALAKEGKTEEAKKLFEQADKLFKFAEPKIGLLPNKLNFKQYETTRRLENEEAINNRADTRDNDVSKALETNTNRSRRTRGVNKRDVRRTERLREVDVNVVAEYSLDNKILSGIKKAFPNFKGAQKIYEITNGDAYRKLMVESLKDNIFAASVTVHSPEDFNGMRMFVTEDGSTGITLTKEGFLGGAFSMGERPNNLAQLIVLGIKEGATTAECFDTILPDYYTSFGFKAVSRIPFNDELKPMVANGYAVKDWDYETYKKYNDGRPDLVFFVYDGGDRNTIEDRIGKFDLYKTYEKENTKEFTKDEYEEAQALMNQMAIKTIEHYEEQEGGKATKESDNKQKGVKGSVVWKHIKDNTPEKENIPNGFKKDIVGRTFKNVDDFNIESLLETDPDFKDFYDANESPRYEEDEVSPSDLSLEIVVVDGVLLDGYSRVASLLRNGETTTNAYVTEATKENVKSEADMLEAMFPEEEMPEGEPTEDMGVAVTNKSAIEKLKSKLNNAQKSKIIESAQKAIKTLKSIFPNMDIHFHEDDASYNATITQNDPNATKNTAGNIMYAKGADGNYTGRIDINLSRASMRTVAHEVAHAVMVRSFGENTKLFKSFRDRVSKMLSETANEKLNEFANQYKESDSHEEFLVELAAALAAEEKQLDRNTVSKIAKLINDVVSKLTNGAIIPFKNVKEMTDINEVVDFINSMSSAISRGEEINIEVFNQKLSTPIGSPVTINKNQIGAEINFKDTPYNLSFVTNADKIDINQLISDIIKKKQKVWFWMADQLGRGYYTDEVINGQHYLDAGPSFALDPVNKSKGILWASGLAVKTLDTQIEKSDYIFFISGSPEKAKLFNKSVLMLIGKRVEKKSSFNEFKKAINNFVPTKDTIEFRKIKNALKNVNSFEELSNTAKRKEFLLAIDSIKKQKTSKEGSIRNLLDSFDIFTDLNELRDGFYRENNFGQNDIMLVGKPTAVGGKAPHSTYENAILGEVVGVPDKKIDAWEIMPQELKDKYEKVIKGKESKTKTMQAKIIAAETGVVRELGNADGTTTSKSQIESEVKQMEEMFPISKSQVEVYHGSPHNFDRFSTEFMGKGEGQQMFGWGLYFTDMISIAENYAKTLGGKSLKIFVGDKEYILNSSNVLYVVKNNLIENNGDIDKTIQFAREMIKELNKGARLSFFDELLSGKGRTIDKYEKAISYLEKNKDKIRVESNKNLYQVSLHKGKSPNQYTWLEWDKPMNEQGFNRIKESLKEKGYTIQNEEANYRFDLYSKKGLLLGRYWKLESGQNLYKNISYALGGDKEASLFLLENGIDGVKYPAESISRGATSDTARGFNYVVFDENAVTIEAKSKAQMTYTGEVLKYFDAEKEMIDKELKREESNKEKYEAQGLIDKTLSALSLKSKKYYSNEEIQNLKGLLALLDRDPLGYFQYRLDEFIQAAKDFPEDNFDAPIDYFKYAIGLIESAQNAEASSTEQVAEQVTPTAPIEAPNIRPEEITQTASRIKKKIYDIVNQARAQGFSEEGIKEFLKRKGLTDEDITTAMGKVDKAATRTELSEETLPGYDKIVSVVQKGLAKGMSIDNMIATIQATKIYVNATDVQREMLVRDVRGMYGMKEKSAPSVTKLFPELKNANAITMTEKDLLKKQFKDLARGAKDAKAAWTQASLELAKYVKELKDSGKITVNQVANVISKFSKVNMFNENSVNNFVDYMANVFADAEYNNKISVAASKLKTVRNNIGTKLGIAKELVPKLNRLFSINPKLVPMEVLDEYLSLVEMLGERTAVLTLDEKNDVISRTDAILDAINNEQEQVEILSEKFNLVDKVLDKDNNVLYADTIDKMVKDDVITEKEAEIMRKYKSEIYPVDKQLSPDAAKIKVDALVREGADMSEAISDLAAEYGMTEDEVNDLLDRYKKENNDLINLVISVDVNSNDLPSRDERKLAKRLKELASSNALKGLTNQELRNLLKVMDNINNGYISHYAQVMVEKMNAFDRSTVVERAIKRSVLLPASKLYAMAKKVIFRKSTTSELTMIQRNPLYYVDQVFGDFKTKDVFDSIFKAGAQALSALHTDLKIVDNMLDRAMTKVSSSHGNKPNEVTNSLYKMGVYLRQLEYESNKGSKQVNPASAYIKATVKHINSGESQYGERDVKMLNQILEMYKDGEGQIDLQKIYNSFNPAEKAAIKTIQDVNESMIDKAMYTASIINGKKINPLANYSHVMVLATSLPPNTTDLATAADNAMNLLPSTKAKSLEEREKNAKAINFDPFASTHRSAKMILTDYHLTEPVRTGRRTLSDTRTKLEDSGNMTVKNRDISNALKTIYDNTVMHILSTSYQESTGLDDAFKFVTTQAYRTVLAGTGRFVSELASNIGFAVPIIANNPSIMKAASKFSSVIMGTNGASIMNNLKSMQTSRVFPTDALSSSAVDKSTLSKTHGKIGGKAMGDVNNKVQQIYNNTLKKYKNSVEFIADTLISTPDKIIMRPIWFGTFASEFNKIAGEDPDFEKIASNDEQYMSEHADHLAEATSKADQMSVFTGATENAFMDISKGKSLPSQSALIKGINVVNGYMQKFMMYDYITARTALMAARGKGMISKREGAVMLGGVVTRIIMYSMLSKMTANLIAKAFGGGDDDDEDEKTFLQKLGQGGASAMSSLILGRTFGSFAKTIINWGVEKVNENYLDFLRNGDYDPFKDNIERSAIPTDLTKDSGFDNFLINMSGPLSPMLKTGKLVWKNVYGPEKKEQAAIDRQQNEKMYRIPLEILGNAGLIPIYKDVRNVVNSSMYKNMKTSSAKLDTSDKEFKAMLKKTDPQTYKTMYGDMDEMISEEGKLNKEMKDEMKRMEKEMGMGQ